jgi:hypothetical protein
MMVDGDLASRFEVFDEADLDTALARFDELSQQPCRLQNTAARVYEHWFASYASRDWTAMANMLTDNSYLEDRRRGVNAGRWAGRDVFIENFRATDNFTLENLGIVATRGERLFLGRFRWSPSDQPPDMFYTEALCLHEIDTDARILAFITFDLDDIDTAFAELDARYLAGEAKPYGHTWSVITRAYAAANRNELPAHTPDWVTLDHRQGRAFGPGELEEYMHATWDVIPDTNIYIESVHRLSNLGAVVTNAVHGTSRDGFDADWREIAVSTIEGDRYSRTELFDEADLEAALARFEELQQQPRQPHNTASQAAHRFYAYLVARNWAGMVDILADECFSDDRRVVNAGLWRGRDVIIAKLRDTTDYGVDIAISEFIATRGQRLVLARVRWSASDQGPDAFPSVALCISEVEIDGRIAAIITFDPDDIDAAFEELDARYLAGEAAAHARTWSFITSSYSVANRHELPGMTPDSVYIDHRALLTTEQEDLAAYLASVWDLTPNMSSRIEAVHRLSDGGAVITHAARGTSQEGPDAEWRVIVIDIVEGDLYSRVEVFDEADLDAALARFDELSRAV